MSKVLSALGTSAQIGSKAVSGLTNVFGNLQGTASKALSAVKESAASVDTHAKRVAEAEEKLGDSQKVHCSQSNYDYDFG